MAKDINQLVQLTDLMEGIRILRDKISGNFLKKTGDRIGTVKVTENETYGSEAPSDLEEEQLFFEKINLNEICYPVGTCILVASNSANSNPNDSLGQTWTEADTITCDNGTVLTVWRRTRINKI